MAKRTTRRKRARKRTKRWRGPGRGRRGLCSCSTETCVHAMGCGVRRRVPQLTMCVAEHVTGWHGLEQRTLQVRVHRSRTAEAGLVTALLAPHPGTLLGVAWHGTASVRGWPVVASHQTHSTAADRDVLQLGEARRWLSLAVENCGPAGALRLCSHASTVVAAGGGSHNQRTKR